MNETNKSNNHYFQDALSDFIYDAASGRAIRHLIDTGHTTAQIARQLNYPTPFAKIRKTVTRYLKETGILLEELPVSSKALHTIPLNGISQEQLYSFLAQRASQNGEENSYISCPFAAYSHTVEGLRTSFSMLTTRELEYLEGIEWEQAVMYHRLDRRMLEIGVQIAMYAKEIYFYFLKSKEVYLSIENEQT